MSLHTSNNNICQFIVMTWLCFYVFSANATDSPHSISCANIHPADWSKHPQCVYLTQTNSPLVCRGGGSINITYEPYSNIVPTPHISILFQKSSVATGGSGENIHSLLPGHCSFPGRPITPNEPDNLIIKSVRNFKITFGKQGIFGANPFIVNLLNETQVQHFNVTYDWRGYFTVDSM